MGRGKIIIKKIYVDDQLSKDTKSRKRPTFKKVGVTFAACNEGRTTVATTTNI